MVRRPRFFDDCVFANVGEIFRRVVFGAGFAYADSRERCERLCYHFGQRRVIGRSFR